ncbi:MAG: hypothetical protein ACHRHE_18280 [Tepidisphaerales bacterium]
MRHFIAATVVALVALLGFALPVRGGSIAGTLSGDSTLTPTATPGIFVQNLTGDGNDTTFGLFTPQSTSTIDFSNPPHIIISDGTFTDTFANGTLFGTSSGTGTASGHGTATVTLDFVFTGGTGIFAGDTGTARFTGTITSTGPTTESITGSYVGSLNTSVPSPAAAAGGFVCLGALALRRVLPIRSRACHNDD